MSTGGAAIPEKPMRGGEEENCGKKDTGTDDDQLVEPPR